MGGGTPGKLSGVWNSLWARVVAAAVGSEVVSLKGQSLGVDEVQGRWWAEPQGSCLLFGLEGSLTHKGLQECCGRQTTPLG